MTGQLFQTRKNKTIVLVMCIFSGTYVYMQVSDYIHPRNFLSIDICIQNLQSFKIFYVIYDNHLNSPPAIQHTGLNLQKVFIGTCIVIGLPRIIIQLNNKITFVLK